MLDTNSTTDLWIRRYHPAPGSPPRLVCLPHAGGSASYYFPVSQALAPDVEVLAVQYPGRQDRRAEPFLRTIEQLADAVTAELIKVVGDEPERPLALFGHSMGAAIGFEVAVRLERAGLVAAGLFVSGRRAPSVHRDERVHLRDDAGLLEDVAALGGTNMRAMDAELRSMALPAIRNDYTAIETYRYQPGPRVNCAIHAMVGDSDPKAAVEDVRAWADHTHDEFVLDVFPGGHFYLDQHAPTILGKITDRLGRART
ncbi:thioesterase [Actinoalloteichus sp. AHMU CJ021]|uniref:thioesterase II family protein n=1 Tax=Actinoalloteichus sp. AHMU CJ021 TaxID=2072503 RepID=UPI000CA02EF2|nr:thioesterase [Actinoalloteichus sp. AHMU CJ021]